MSSSTADTVTIDRLEYASLLRDRALAEKVRGMELGSYLCCNVSGRWVYQKDHGFLAKKASTPEEALGVGEAK